MAALATMYTENHGHLEARTTEYAQDKMEQLLALAYTDTVSDTVVFPAAAIGGTGLAVGGSTNTAAPVNGYVDWLGPGRHLLGGGTRRPPTGSTSGSGRSRSPRSGRQADHRRRRTVRDVRSAAR